MAALTDAEIQTVLDAWPADDAGLPGSVQTALDSWTAQTMGPINAAITQSERRPRFGVYYTERKGILEGAQGAHIGRARRGGRSWRPHPSTCGACGRWFRPRTSISEKIRVMEQQLRTQRQEIADSKAEIAGLQKVQDAIDTDRDVTADYVGERDGDGSRRQNRS